MHDGCEHPGARFQAKELIVEDIIVTLQSISFVT